MLSVSEKTKVLIIGQAPGKRVNETGVPWSDKSGDNLIDWLGITRNQFLDPDLFGTMPMGFCYPGKNQNGNGDAPPRPECKPAWHKKILQEMNQIQLTILVGQYAINAYLPNGKKRNLTETVRNYFEYLPTYFPLVHPSPLNYRWHSKNKWFKTDILPILKERIKCII